MNNKIIYTLIWKLEIIKLYRTQRTHVFIYFYYFDPAAYIGCLRVNNIKVSYEIYTCIHVIKLIFFDKNYIDKFEIRTIS